MVKGSILFGFATPSEAGAVGAFEYHVGRRQRKNVMGKIEGDL